MSATATVEQFIDRWAALENGMIVVSAEREDDEYKVCLKLADGSAFTLDDQESKMLEQMLRIRMDMARDQRDFNLLMTVRGQVLEMRDWCRERNGVEEKSGVL